MSGVTIERAENGWIVRRMRGDGALGAATPQPLVFDSFERLTDWLAQHYLVAPRKIDDKPTPYPRTPIDPFGMLGPRAIDLGGLLRSQDGIANTQSDSKD